jgi:hypothetical protein
MHILYIEIYFYIAATCFGDIYVIFRNLYTEIENALKYNLWINNIRN